MRGLGPGRLVLFVFFALPGMAAPPDQEPPLPDSAKVVWIASGTPGGTYRDVYAPRLERQLWGFDVVHRKTSGSGENLDLLADRKADLAFVQADILAARVKSSPDRFGDLRILGKLSDECVYLARRKKGPVRDLESLTKPVDGRNARVAVGVPESGMAGTWRFMVDLRPGLGNAEVIHKGDLLALNQLGVGLFDAMGWVTDPGNFEHRLLLAVNASEDLTVMDLKGTEIKGTLPDGTAVYEHRTVRLGKAWNAPKVTTLCTTALVVSRRDANPALVAKVAEIVGLRRELVVPER